MQFFQDFFERKVRVFVKIWADSFTDYLAKLAAARIMRKEIVFVD